MAKLSAVLVLFLAMTFVSLGTMAGDGVPKPDIPRGKGDRCVRDVDFMRKNHMDLLLHERDLTVHNGIRPAGEALTNCIACHSVKGANAEPITAKDPKHFCRECHDYAAVTIDCFECHASRPQAANKLTLFPIGERVTLSGRVTK
ncbi:MAG: Hdr-like menaquinol oxidoreductase cytochrome c subunit [Rhodospirillaceae bacterium]|nr:Hdr-like menaquinol oxidoreductase cytochrome c subunit [Rhodospirillaceae bacterium]MBT6138585.1 Hdr-like menaquinol oxidoreductase cytochrome c subunit [Rhodospirillaceae bacterium]